MLQTIQKQIQALAQVSAWIIKEEQSLSAEVFCIQNKIDMNRSCQTHEYNVRLFVDFEENGTKYKGDSSVNISLSDSQEEVIQKLSQTAFAAGFVKNPWYALPSNTGKAQSLQARPSVEDFKAQFQDIHNVIYKAYPYKAKINCCELFATQKNIRVLTSTGVDVTYPKNSFSMELVTDCNDGAESVEIFNLYHLTSVDLVKLEAIVSKQLMETEGRAFAVRNPKIEKINVILSNEAVEELLNFYLAQAKDSAVYQKISRLQKGARVNKEDNVQNINIRINPLLASALDASPVDTEGKILSAYPLITNNVLQNYITTAKFSHYLGEEHIGYSNVFEVECGDTSYTEFTSGDYIEILAFSSFIMDTTTGDFGGEFRLAKYIKDGVAGYITGGSISENIFTAQNTMRFSKEQEVRSNSITPKAILLPNITVAGE